MPLETGDYIQDLIPTNPAGNDLVSDGDNHIRLIKKVLTNTFPGADKASDLFTADPTKFREQKNLLRGHYNVEAKASGEDLSPAPDIPHYTVDIDTGTQWTGRHSDPAVDHEAFTVEVVGTTVNFDTRRPQIQFDAPAYHLGIPLVGNALMLMGNNEAWKCVYNGATWQLECIAQPTVLPLWRLHDDADGTIDTPTVADQWALRTFGSVAKSAMPSLHKVNNLRDIQPGVSAIYAVTLTAHAKAAAALGGSRGHFGWAANNGSEGGPIYRKYNADAVHSLSNASFWTHSIGFTGPIQANDRISCSYYAEGGTQYYQWPKNTISLAVEMIRR